MTAPDKSPPQVIHGNGGYSRPECHLIIGSLRSIGDNWNLCIIGDELLIYLI